MRLMPVAALLLAAVPVFAGTMVTVHCPECGFVMEDGLEMDTSDPGIVTEVYFDPETGEFHLVGFDAVLIASGEIAVNINQNYRGVEDISVEEVAVNINQNYRGIGMETAEEIAVNINQNYHETGEVTAQDIAVTINNNHRAVEGILAAWSAPETLAEFMQGGRVSPGLTLGEGVSGEPGSWELVNRQNPHLCPECGTCSVQYEVSGY